ncbi:acyltransferase family protein [Vulgatibacter incomptus]|uniref:Acyltransferase 3 n=1 Tax=Vulgatibacter incomptus TaxID=1391653 RepID=A0A0K1P8I5_9BACT|nr:acyltransferase [Vulgatibacter incomptus]AKU89843.1 acyltransferase 3 [Vulgatibacter incomptus]
MRAPPSLDEALPTSPLGAAAEAAAPELAIRGHMPALDGVRGLAVLLVLLLHFVGNTTATNRFESALLFVSGYGMLGVDLFFVLSGFLITGILYDSRGAPGYFRNFYMRRVLRIFPLYYGTLIAFFLVAPFVGLHGAALDELRGNQSWLWLYGANVFHAIQGKWALSYLNHFWSLAVEEHFYFVWPLLVWWLGSRPRALLWTSLGLVIASPVASAAATLLTGNPTIKMITPFQLQGLALGGFLAVLARQPGGTARIRRWVPRIALGVGGALAASFFWHRLSEVGQSVMGPIRPPLFVVLLGCLLIQALASPRGTWTSRFFTGRTMTFLGTYSYGLYVFHHFISYAVMTHGTEQVLAGWIGNHTLAIFVQASLGISLSIAVAYASYHLFERRFLVLKRYFSHQR